MPDELFFNNWSTLVRTIILGTCSYGAVVLFIRVSGKRILSQLNAFDFIITVAFGSTLATILLSKDVVLAQGLAALGLLVMLQYVVAKASVLSGRLQKLFKSDPTLLLLHGKLLDDALHEQRVTREEVESAVRGIGIPRIEDVAAIILETNGKFSIIPELSDSDNTALANVKGFEVKN